MGAKDHEINIEEVEDPYLSLVSSITKNELEKVRTRSPTTCIYRVPDGLRRANAAAYTPQVVSIGPIHHDKSSKIMKDHKRQFLKYFLERTNKDLIHYVEIVKNSEKKLRDCYEETFEFSSDQFCYIILVDAVFIVEIFLSSYPKLTFLSCYRELTTEVPLQLLDEKVRERLFYARQVLRQIWPELLLLENQLPFFILEEIWKDAATMPIVQFFYWYYCTQLDLNLEEKDGTNLKNMPMHFVDLVRTLYIPLNPKSRKEKLETLQAPNATELHQAGIKFRVRSSKNLFDISFCNGVLEIPKLRIMDDSESIMRNLAALEQCQYERQENYICDYLTMLDYLVNTPEDVDLLVKNQIFEHLLGDSKDVSAMINKLFVGVYTSPENFYFGDIFNQLNKHYKFPWNQWKANLKQKYFNTPWTITSFIAAFFLLILTIIQTIGTIISWI